MSESKPREFYMDTDILDRALDSCDLGDSYGARVRMYPHKDMLDQLTKVIEYSAFEALQKQLETFKWNVNSQREVNDRQWEKYQKLEAELKLKEKQLEIAVTVLESLKKDNYPHIVLYTRDALCPEGITISDWCGQALAEINKIK